MHYPVTSTTYSTGFTILVGLALLLGLASCAKPETEEEGEELQLKVVKALRDRQLTLTLVNKRREEVNLCPYKMNIQIVAVEDVQGTQLSKGSITAKTSTAPKNTSTRSHSITTGLAGLTKDQRETLGPYQEVALAGLYLHLPEEALKATILCKIIDADGEEVTRQEIQWESKMAIKIKKEAACCVQSGATGLKFTVSVENRDEATLDLRKLRYKLEVATERGVYSSTKTGQKGVELLGADRLAKGKTATFHPLINLNALSITDKQQVLAKDVYVRLIITDSRDDVWAGTEEKLAVLDHTGG
ncbi:MAG: hypothetical protein ROO73_00465 [Roseivirga sp.]